MSIYLIRFIVQRRSLFFLQSGRKQAVSLILNSCGKFGKEVIDHFQDFIRKTEIILSTGSHLSSYGFGRTTDLRKAVREKTYVLDFWLNQNQGTKISNLSSNPGTWNCFWFF